MSGGTPKIPSKAPSSGVKKVGGAAAVPKSRSTPELPRRTPDGAPARQQPGRPGAKGAGGSPAGPKNQAGAGSAGKGRAPETKGASDPKQGQGKVAAQAAEVADTLNSGGTEKKPMGAKSRAMQAENLEEEDHKQNAAVKTAGAALDVSGLSGTARGLTGRMSDGSKMDTGQRVLSIASDYVPYLREIAKIPGFEKVIGKINNKRYILMVWLSAVGPFLPTVFALMVVVAIAMSGVSTQQSALIQAATKVQQEAASADEQVQAQQCVTGTNATKTDDMANGCDKVNVTSSGGGDGSSSNELGSASADRQAVVDYARQFLGVPYTWGGNNPDEGMDCSGYMVWIFTKFNISLPRTAEAMRDVGKSVTKDQLKPGDLIVWTDHGHVAMYVGDDKMVEEPKPGLSAREVPLRDPDKTIFRSIIND
ncbi:hypothetical protein F8O07_06800 [Pseudoclavibacter sp. CFCC 13796]|uniref:C40 family peptidase n=1 Tax=Pseudoclavibacter sp. CFCC 13796 TaxID=2615179 RepID=UPI0013017521|nr:C40 family peptidase [Pseudoclavibacter sp. CFCC 13796]KAB1661607.1 hypothetical protein F8O07_06800 [Pseudoclavibacter sp. CFCC 13796]